MEINKDIRCFLSAAPQQLSLGNEVKWSREMKTLQQIEKIEAKTSDMQPKDILYKTTTQKHLFDKGLKTNDFNIFFEETMKNILTIKQRPDLTKVINCCKEHREYFASEGENRKRIFTGNYGKSAKYLKLVMYNKEEGKENYLPPITLSTEEENFRRKEDNRKYEDFRARFNNFQREYRCLSYFTSSKDKREPFEKRIEQLTRKWGVEVEEDLVHKHTAQ